MVKPTPNLNRPAYAQRPSMRPHTLSRKIQTAQTYRTKKNPAKITLAPMPKEWTK